MSSRRPKLAAICGTASLLLLVGLETTSCLMETPGSSDFGTQADARTGASAASSATTEPPCPGNAERSDASVTINGEVIAWGMTSANVISKLGQPWVAYRAGQIGWGYQDKNVCCPCSTFHYKDAKDAGIEHEITFSSKGQVWMWTTSRHGLTRGNERAQSR